MVVSVLGTIDTNNFFIVLNDLVSSKCLLVGCKLSDLFAVFVYEMQLRHPEPVAGSSELFDFCKVHIQLDQTFVGLFLCQEERASLAV